MKIKSFRKFENQNLPEDTVRMSDGGEYPAKTVYSELGPDTYYKDDYLAFVGAVEDWMKRTGGRIMWALTPFGYSQRNATNENKSKVIWDSLVTDDREMTLIEMEDKLIAVLHEDGKIIFALDNEDRPVDLELVKNKI